MTKQENAANVFSQGMNCAQSVVTTFSEDYGLDASIACRIAGGLGGGARCAELCGAASGAALVIGLRYGAGQVGDAEAKQKCNEETIEFMSRFRAANGSIVCRDLLECDTSTDEGKEIALSKNLFTTKCKDLVVSATNILIDMGY
jgi:C_GCAxxG_C_C family probable redox protein